MSSPDWDAEDDSQNRSSEELQDSQSSAPRSPSLDWPSDRESDPEDRVPLACRRIPRMPPTRGLQAAAGRAPTRAHQAEAGTSSRAKAESPGEIASSITGQDLTNIRARYQIPREIILFPPTPDDRVISSRPGRVALYEIGLRLGLRPPFHFFFLNLLDYYSLTPSQLVPNSIRVICAFVVLCHLLNITPRVSLFRTFYILRSQRGWWLFQPRPNRALKLFLPSSVKGWKPRFFFASLDKIKPKWGKPDTRGNANSTILPGDKEAFGRLLATEVPRYNMFLSEGNLLSAGIIAQPGK